MSLEITNNTQTNDFDVTKITNLAKAKNIETGTVENRIYIDEREISPQMNIGLKKISSADAYEFRENMISEDGNPAKIYNNCPSNLIQFIFDYREKYNKFPVGNLTVTYYDEGGEFEVQSQGVAECTFNPDSRETVDKSDDFMQAYSSSAPFQLLTTGAKRKTSNNDMYIEAATLTISQLENPVTLFVAPYIESPTTEMFYMTSKYGVKYSDDYESESPTANKYYWGYLTGDQIILGEQMLYSTVLNQILGTFELSATKSGTEWSIDNITFTPTATEKAITAVNELNISYYPNAGELVKEIKIISRHTGNMKITSLNMEQQVFEFVFTYKYVGEETGTATIAYYKYDDWYKLNNNRGEQPHFIQEVEQTEHKYKNISFDSVPDGTRTAVIPTYMYFDPALKLPDILQ